MGWINGGREDYGFGWGDDVRWWWTVVLKTWREEWDWGEWGSWCHRWGGKKRNEWVEVSSNAGFWEFHQKGVVARPCAWDSSGLKDIFQVFVQLVVDSTVKKSGQTKYWRWAVCLNLRSVPRSELTEQVQLDRIVGDNNWEGKWGLTRIEVIEKCSSPTYLWYGRIRPYISVSCWGIQFGLKPWIPPLPRMQGETWYHQPTEYIHPTWHCRWRFCTLELKYSVVNQTRWCNA